MGDLILILVIGMAVVLIVLVSLKGRGSRQSGSNQAPADAGYVPLLGDSGAGDLPDDPSSHHHAYTDTGAHDGHSSSDFGGHSDSGGHSGGDSGGGDSGGGDGGGGDGGGH